MRPLADILDPAALDVHTTDEDRIGPGEIAGARRLHIFIGEADLPDLWKCCRDYEKSLWRHERAHSAGQRIGIFEGAKGRDITWKNAENFPNAFIMGRQDWMV